ncbi:MAG: DinB family protein [Gemmatimonadota bacterium]|nr:DinB family protein [Gemmatimonadota bacterium]
MSAAAGLVAQLESSHKFFKGTLSVFDEDESGFAPQPEMFSVAAHVRHVAETVDWFMEGGFGDGWQLDFEAHVAHSHEATSLAAEIERLDAAYGAATAKVSGLGDGELYAPITDEAIMGGAPRAAVINGITDHSAHHRGALAVYARLLGKEPAMPYA